MSNFAAADLEAYLDEALPPAEMARIETAIRDDAELRAALGDLLTRRDQGEHTLGGIWRQRRLSCPDRGQLRAYLAGTLPPEFAGYIAFHVNTIGCRYCHANVDDLGNAE